MLYTCGSSLKGLEMEVRLNENEDVLSLFERVYVRENFSCEDPVEIPYYSSEKFAPTAHALRMTDVKVSIHFVTIVEGRESSLSSRERERPFQNSYNFS